MRVIVTGAGGFVGRALVQAIAETGQLVSPSGERRPVERLVLVDRNPIDGITAGSVDTDLQVGDLRDEDFLRHVIGAGADSIFHLAATLTIEAERDTEAGWAVNMMLPKQLMDACARSGRTTRFVYASSIAVFGGDLPDAVDDHHCQTPQTCYGTAKAITELLINDYSRRGVVDGRALRLPIVLMRPGEPVPVVSDIIASLAREPMRGRPVVSPIDPDIVFPVVSVGRVADNLVRLHNLPAAAFSHSRALNQPGLSVSAADILTALARVAGPETAALVRFAPDPAVQAVIECWPRHFVSTFASENPFEADADVDAILQDHLKRTGR